MAIRSSQGDGVTGWSWRGTKWPASSHRDSDNGCDPAPLAGHVDLPGDAGMVRYVDTEFDAELAVVLALKLEIRDAALAARTVDVDR
jgi:hypothetical protein